jgi:topoisomerase-4 subunit A
LEILDGYLLVYLNLDEVIRIIREEEQPKPKLMDRFSLSDIQAEAILNMRLRSLRRLEELEIRKEHKSLSKERKDLQTLLKSEPLRWARITEELEATRTKFGSGPLGNRRTEIGAAPAQVDVSYEALVEREPITVILSEKGWIRAVKGSIADPNDLKFKEGDKLKLSIPCQTTDRLCMLATNGKTFTLKASDLPRGRGDGQPVRLLADLSNEDDIVTLFVPAEGARYLIASSSARGFIIPAEDLNAEKRTGKQVMTLKPDEKALLIVPAEGDLVVVVGQNRRLLMFPVEQLPVQGKGAGIILQRYRDGGLADAKVIRATEGLTWRIGDRTRIETDLRPWRGDRGTLGHPPPTGFPRPPKFNA